jgi:hypothetical protein
MLDCRLPKEVIERIYKKRKVNKMTRCEKAMKKYDKDVEKANKIHDKLLAKAMADYCKNK